MTVPDDRTHDAEAAVAAGPPDIPPTDPPRIRTDRVVFGISAALVVAIVVWGLAAPDNFSSVTGSVLDWIVIEMGWLFVLSATAFVIFVLWIAASKYGQIPLGKDEEEPEFRTVSWIAMMFSAGMGIGLMFFGVSEPVSHYVTAPPGTDGGTGVAMATTMFHWSLHPWAIYAVVGLAIAYGTFRKGRKQLMSAAFIPLLGRRTEGPIGKLIDILALYATLFGTAASLGLGALQIGSGFEVTGWLETAGVGLLVAIVAVLT
ncbi:MAG TPA: BCCT family transporter, partial [Rhodococcus sp. (in: high G+C Gram-positive bacteria)]|nr:BCCT family transporter [Rhodococcus sp. (in: high G+C Gram-positive bacteria)]